MGISATDRFILLMEGTEILLLLEEVLTGKILDRTSFEKKTFELHKALVTSPAAFLRASSIISRRLNESKKIQEKNYQVFQKYINEALTDKKPKSLPLVHFPISDKRVKKAGGLILEINKVNNRMIALIHSSFSDLKLNACKVLFTCKVKVRAGASIIHKAKAINLRILKSSFKIWNENIKISMPWKRKAVCKGKNRDKIIKLNVFKRIVKNISLGFEPIAFLKWKIKINEYNELKGRFIKAIKKSESYFKNIVLKRWKCFNKDSKRKRRKLLENTIVVLEKHYFFLMLNVLNLLRYNDVQEKRLGKMDKKSNHALRSVKRPNIPNQTGNSLSNLDQTKGKLFNVLKISTVRYFYMKKKLFKDFSSKLRVKEDIKASSCPQCQSFQLGVQFLKTQGLTRQGGASKETNIIRRVFQTCTLRYFFSKTVVFNKWKGFRDEESISEVNHHSIIKRKRTLTPKSKRNEDKLDFTDRITSHTIHLKKLTKPNLKKLLRSSKRMGEDINVKMSKIIAHLCKVSNARKSFKTTTLNKWKTYSSNIEYLTSIKLKCVFCLVRRKMIQNELKKLAFAKWGNYTNTEEKIDGHLSLHQLALNAIEMKNSTKILLKLWKQNHNKCDKSLKAKAKIVFRSMRKATRLRIMSGLSKWQSEVILNKIKGIPKQKAHATTIIKPKNTPMRKGINQENLHTRANHLQSILAKSELRYFFCKLLMIKQWQTISSDHSIMKSTGSAYRSFQFKMKNTISQLVKLYSSKNRFLTKKNFNKWRFSSRSAEYNKATQLKVIFRLIKRAMNNRERQKKALDKWINVKNFIEESKTLQSLATKAIEMKNSSKTILKLWKKGIKKHGIQKKSAKSKIALRSFKKLKKAKIFSVFYEWRQVAINATIKINKIEEMVRVLNNSLIKNSAEAFKVPRMFTQLSTKYKFKSKILTGQGIVNASRINTKILYCMLNSMLQKQLQFSFEKLNEYKKLHKKITRRSLSSFLNVSENWQGIEKSINEASNPSIISTAGSLLLSKDGMLSVSLLGAVEVISLVLSTSLCRKMAWAFTSINIFTLNLGQFDEERGRFVEEINCLRYDKHSLLDDNNNLRLHNEALIENLERIDENCYTLSCMLNKMKLSRMVNIISKMLDAPLLDALLTMKINTELALNFEEDYQLL